MRAFALSDGVEIAANPLHIQGAQRNLSNLVQGIAGFHSFFGQFAVAQKRTGIGAGKEIYGPGLCGKRRLISGEFDEERPAIPSRSALSPSGRPIVAIAARGPSVGAQRQTRRCGPRHLPAPANRLPSPDICRTSSTRNHTYPRRQSCGADVSPDLSTCNSCRLPADSLIWLAGRNRGQEARPGVARLKNFRSRPLDLDPDNLR